MPLTPVRRQLPNGVTLIAQENPATPAVSLAAVVRTGTFEDPPGREGTAALLARSLDRGTRTRTGDQIADELDGIGAALSIAAGRHQVGLSATCLADDYAAVLASAADLLRAPVFPEAEVRVRLRELVTIIRQEEDDPASVAAERLWQELYGPHPYARALRGTVASVESLDRADLVAFHTAHLLPSRLVVVAVGSLPAAAMLDAATTAFAEWAADPGRVPAVVPDAPPARSRREVRVAMPDKAQADIAYGFVGIRRSDPAYMPASVMNNVLGQFALGGRLGDSIRERQGMAYYVFSALDAGVGPGPVSIRAGVSEDNIDRTIASIDREIDAVRAEGFTETEVAESVQYLTGALPRQLETNAGMAGFLLNAELFDLGLDYDRRLPDLLQAVTRDAVIDQARRLLDPQQATVVVAGPAGAHTQPALQS
ncbi:MAG: pitrilysin family protein [Vicinamibacterales bacterium]